MRCLVRRQNILIDPASSEAGNEPSWVTNSRPMRRVCSPNPNVAGADDAFEIPLRSVALSSSTYFPVMHYMGEKPAVRLYLSNNMYSTNACMQQQVRPRRACKSR